MPDSTPMHTEYLQLAKARPIEASVLRLGAESAGKRAGKRAGRGTKCSQGGNAGDTPEGAGWAHQTRLRACPQPAAAAAAAPAATTATRASARTVILTQEKGLISQADFDTVQAPVR